MSMAENERAVVGSNQAPEYAKRVTEQMARDYAAAVTSVTALLDEAREAPKEVTDQETALALGALIKRLRDLDKRLEAFRLAEKEPFLRGGDAVDQFFHAQRDKLTRRLKTNRPGAADVLQDRVNQWLEEKRAAEEAERRRVAEEEARKARAAREEEDRLRRAAEEARTREERARKAENAAAHAAVAEKAEREAAEAAAATAAADARAQEAHIATLAKPADMSRTRGDDGVLLTQAREPYVIVTDRSKLDWSIIRNFFTDAEVEKAVRGWAKTTGHNKPMDGAEIGHRFKGVTR